MMRSKVDLPQPDGPTSDEEFAVRDIEIDVAEDRRFSEGLRNPSELEPCHVVVTASRPVQIGC